ncbi:TolC family protein [Duganella vulcania]|uniref:TolC family protein n=1 Tax=Duganella vulcania TaxID=2692166 RepID=A0A845GTA1_9BURK|nr:TolC family protein [Duganella vulcania]MYM96448.1 TolC family protein [Duganella vulcania]
MSISLPRGRMPHGALLSLLLGATAAAHAETPSYAELLRQAQSRAPQLLAQAASTRAAAADALQARAWNNPSLNVTAENLGGPKPGGVTQRQDTYTLTQVFEAGGKRSARIEAEARKADAAGIQEKQARILYANELALAYATAEALQLRSEVADGDVARAEEDLRAAQALVKAGREADLRVAQARASAAASQAAAQSAAAAAVEALERLSALAGAAESYTRIDRPFLAVAAARPVAQNWSAEQAPAFASAAAERDAVQAQVRVEEKRWMPDVGVSVGMRKFGWSNESAAVVGVTLNVPLFDRNQSGVNAATERANAATLRLEAARLETLAQHRAALAQMAAAERSLQAAQLSESAATEAYRLGRIGYDAGKTALIELLAIRRALSEAKTLTIEASLARVRAIATLSLAEGRIAFGEAP